jgi:DNA-binding SARP family transcriptional activator/tetratricopeptide (TPR) repeat protein
MAYLVMNRRTEAARDRLLEIFWPDADPDRARDSLKTALWSIRRCLKTAGVEADDFLQVTKSTLRWTADTIVDAIQFADLAGHDNGNDTREALDLFHGEFLEGDYDNWAVAERERLAGLYERVLSRVVRTGKDAEAAQLLVARNPYDEEAYVTLIETELAAGRRSAAASWIDRCRTALSEIGDKPSEAFEARFRSVARIDPVVPDELALPFAGREPELGLLAGKIADASAGHGCITLVHGEAGIGKSTLLNRITHIAREHRVRVLHIQCGNDVASPFGPWQSAFRAVNGGDFDTFARAHGADVASAVAQAIAASFDEPALIIVDDAHELTGDALEIFIALARSVSSKHAVIAGSRPEGIAQLRLRLDDHEPEEISLGRLDRKNLKWALSQALGNEQTEVLDVLYARSGGHPLFFTGLLNALVNDGALTRDGRRWQLTKHIDVEMELPDTVKRFIEARLQARGDAPRAVACALALEPAAHADDLASVLRYDESTTLDALDDLLSLALIIQPPAGSQFAFAHDLIREVAALGLNAGRRTLLHRAFAQRLAASGELEASVRLARHFQAAGELLAAAQAYLKSAQAALELNAAQDALERCDAGIVAAEKLERTPSRDLILAKLYRTSAQAAMNLGNPEDAIRRAREAVTAARTSEDVHESSRAMLDLSVVEGAAFHVAEQESDATEAARTATVSGDAALEALALVQKASAARRLGRRDEALEACRAAYELAQRCERPDIVAAVLEERLRTQMTWWLFSEAMETARGGLDVARRSGPPAEAAMRLARGGLWYLLERLDEAQSEIRAGTRAADDAARRQRGPLGSPIHSLPVIRFVGCFMAAKISNERQQWDEVAQQLENAYALTNVAKLPRFAQALVLLNVDVLLRRRRPGDEADAHARLGGLGAPSFPQDTIGWSDCVELARARDATRHRAGDAQELVRDVLNVLEGNAHQAPLDVDHAFDRLAAAAAEIDAAAVATRAQERSRYYKSCRRAAAGASLGE